MSKNKKWQPKIDMRQFEKGHCVAEHITLAHYNQKYITLPCNCERDECKGWAAVLRDKNVIQHHLVFHLPSNDDLANNWP